MTGYAIASIIDAYEELGEEKFTKLLSQFSCPLNGDVETFFRDKRKVLEFAKQGIAVTYIVMASYKKKPVLVGYFTIAIDFSPRLKPGDSRFVDRSLAWQGLT